MQLIGMVCIVLLYGTGEILYYEDMGLFGKRRVAGISAYELDRKRLRSRLRSAFPHGTTGDRKMAALDTALSVAMDADANTPHDQQVVQAGEFDMIVDKLREHALITEGETDSLRAIAAKDLKD